jgi:cysteine/O-acetylserine efflux protein
MPVDNGFGQLMSIQLLPLLSYVLISTFTPGPSNISSASLGVLHGYKHTLAYQAGLAVPVFLLMFLSGLVSATLLESFPILEPLLRYGGVVYILYLAFSLLQASYVFAEQAPKPLGFGHGFMLQFLNPKLTVYAFTLFSTFLAPITNNLLLLALTAALLAATSFVATSLWALCGSAIKSYLHLPRLKIVINGLLALALVYAALALTGIV